MPTSSQSLWIVIVLTYCHLVTGESLKAQAVVAHRPSSGMIRRYQQMQQQQAKQAEQFQKAYLEYQQQLQARLLAQQAYRKTQMAQRHERLEKERQARIEKNKQHLKDESSKTAARRDSATAPTVEPASKTETDSASTESLDETLNSKDLKARPIEANSSPATKSSQK